MRSGLIVVRYANQVMPDEFKLLAVQNYGTAIGYAVVDEKVVLNDFYDPLEGIDLIDALEKTDEKFKDKHVFYHFTKVDDVEKEFDADSIQPFNVITKEDKTLLSVMLEGEGWEEYKDKEGPNTPEFHFVNDLLGGYILDMYEELGHDMAKLLAKLDTAEVRAEIRPYLLPRGEIHIIPNEGKPMAFLENSKQGSEFPWGYVTKTMGYTEAVAETPAIVEEPKRPLSLQERKARQAALAKSNGSEPPAVTEPKPSVPSVNPNDKKDTVTLPGQPEEIPGNAPFLWRGKNNGTTIYSKKKLDNTPELWCKVRSGANRDEAKKFWNANCTYEKPKDDKLLLAGFPFKALKPDSPLKAAAAKFGLAPAEGAIGSAFRDAQQKTADKPKIAGAAVDTMAKHTDEDKLRREEAKPLLVSAASKQKAVDMLKAGQPVMNNIAEELGEFPPFSKQVAIPFATLIRWRPKVINELSHDSLVAFCNELRMKLHEVKPQLFEPPAVQEKEEEQTPKRPLSLAERKAAQQKSAA